MIYRYRAFTIIEIMIAMTLGLILLTGITYIYLTTKKTYRVQENMARLQENGRFATDILTRNIRMAGYGGCNNSNLSEAIKGFDSTNLPSYLQSKVASGTDVIVIRKADTKITHLIKNIDNPTNVIEVENNPATKSNRKLFISDCQHGYLFAADNYNGTTIKTNVVIKPIFKKLNTEVAQYTEIAYFISKTPYKDESGNPIYALYSITNKGRKEELIDGIKNMQIVYGVDTNGDGIVDNYYPAREVSSWNKVLSVFITLYLDAGENKTKQWKTYIALRERIQAQY